MNNLTRKERVMLPKEQKRLFLDFRKSAIENKVLDKKTTALVKLAASMALGCID